MSLLLRFLVGGLAVSAFATLADILQPKSFAGLFGAAPSIALASLALTFHTDGRSYVLAETRSMMAGAVAFLFCAVACTQLMARWRWRAIAGSTVGLAVWFLCAFTLRFLLFR